MKSFLSSLALAVVLSSPGSEAFAPASTSRRVAVISPSASVHVQQRHDGQKRPQPSHLFATKDESSDEDAADGTPSRRAKFLSNIRRKSKPITLALLTATSATFLPGSRNVLLQPAKASAPIVLRENAKKEEPPMVVAEKKAEKLRKKRSMEEFDAFMEKANNIEETDGKAARDEFEAQYTLEKEAKEAQKKVDIENLKRKLLDAGQDPHSDIDAEGQVFMFEHDINLEKVSGTPQNEQMIKTFRKKGKGVPTYEKQRYIIACQVADLKARGIDPMEHFSERDVMDKTRAIYRMDDKIAEKVAGQYEALMKEHGGRLTPANGEVPFVYSAESAVASSAAAVASGSTDSAADILKEQKAEARAAAKAARAAEKEAALEAKAQAKAERAEARAAAKADKAAAKDAKLAEKAAGAAAALAAKEGAAAAVSAAATVAPSMELDGEIAATANGDVFATAGNNAVAESSVEKVTQQKASTSSSSSSKASDLIATAKSYATPRNAATTVVVGGAAVYGFNYWQENSAGAQSDREAQLKLILGNDLDDDEDDDDEFDDDDEEDAFEQFTQKKPTPPKAVDSTPKETKPVSPPKPPAVPAPKPKRKLGIFAKRNANARETDLNVMVGPKAQAPEFATLLTQTLTFGAPGRFPAVASWGDMPFEKFELDNAKALLTESRENADLSDEQSAEIFASVVNCMIIDIVDLASATLKGKDKDEKLAVDAINVVMDFMDHAASLFDAVAKDVTIKPVTYGGNLRKKDLEQMFSVYAGSSMMGMGLDSTGTTQDRVDTLQLVFAITDKKAEGLMQKHMMKMMMNLMKDGGKGEGGMPGMEGMEDMMKMMGGADGMPGMPGMDGEVSPEELKQTVGMMKELMDSGQVSEDELAEVRGQFKEMYGSDIADLIKKADEEGAGEAMSEDERALLDMFKQILGE